LQREKVSGAAVRIESFVQEVERLIAGAMPPPGGPPLSIDQRRNDLQRLLRQAPAVTEVSYIDTAGREQVRVSSLRLNMLDSQIDRSTETAFLSAKSGSTYFSPVYFFDESEPYMTIGWLSAAPAVG